MSTTLNSYRPKGAPKNLHVAGLIRTGFVFVVAALTVCCVITLVSLRFVRREPPTKRDISLSKSVATSPPSVPATPFLPNDFNQTTPPIIPSEDSDTDKIPVVADRPRFAAGRTNSPHRSAQKDPELGKVVSSLRDYRATFRENPIGSNAEITRILSGKNSRGIRYLPANVRINKEGELTDRSEQPLMFHQISGTIMEIRSAGPDHVMWTADDEVLR